MVKAPPALTDSNSKGCVFNPDLTAVSRLNIDVQKALLLLEKKGDTFQIIYSDPPYELAHFQASLLSFLDRSSLITTGSIVFLEEGAPSKLTLAQTPLTRLVYKNSRKFGKSLLHQYIARA